MKFLAQTINGKIVHDFVFAVLQARDYFAWRGVDTLDVVYHEGMDFGDIKHPDDYIPVGSVDYVSSYLRAFYPKAVRALRPLNVPPRLIPYAGRPVVNVTSKKDLELLPDDMGAAYAKHLDVIKHPDNGLVMRPAFRERINYQLSGLIRIESEWRVLVFHDEIKHIANYSGDPLVFPDGNAILRMVECYRNYSPVAYTLDVAVTTGKKTVVVECHRFFSCGLYGFSDASILPYMLSQAWFEMRTRRD